MYSIATKNRFKITEMTKLICYRYNLLSLHMHDRCVGKLSLPIIFDGIDRMCPKLQILNCDTCINIWICGYDLNDIITVIKRMNNNTVRRMSND